MNGIKAHFWLSIIHSTAMQRISRRIAVIVGIQSANAYMPRSFRMGRMGVSSQHKQTQHKTHLLLERPQLMLDEAEGHRCPPCPRWRRGGPGSGPGRRRGGLVGRPERAWLLVVWRKQIRVLACLRLLAAFAFILFIYSFSFDSSAQVQLVYSEIGVSW